MKRYLTIAVVVLLGLALVAGSVYVVAQSGSEDCEEEERIRAGQVNGVQGEGQGLGLGIGNGSGSAQGQGQGQGQGQQRGAGQGESEGQFLSEVIAEGRVVAHDEELLLDTGEEQLLEVHTGPRWYWDENGYEVSEGDQLRVTGFEHEGEFEAAEIDNETSGQWIELRDEAGRPLWAGRGRGQ